MSSLCSVCSACVEPVLSLCSACVQCVQCVQHVFSMCSACVQPVFSLCPACVQCVQCVQHVFSLCSACVQHVFSLCSVCSACVQPVFSMSNRLHRSMCCTILRCNQFLNKTSSYALKFKRTFNLTAYNKADLKNVFNFILQIFQVGNFYLKYSQIVKASTPKNVPRMFSGSGLILHASRFYCLFPSKITSKFSYGLEFSMPATKKCSCLSTCSNVLRMFSDF